MLRLIFSAILWEMLSCLLLFFKFIQPTIDLRFSFMKHNSPKLKIVVLVQSEHHKSTISFFWSFEVQKCNMSHSSLPDPPKKDFALPLPYTLPTPPIQFHFEVLPHLPLCYYFTIYSSCIHFSSSILWSVIRIRRFRNILMDPDPSPFMGKVVDANLLENEE